MLVSVIVRTRNEADRLRLVLCSLARQTEAGEVIAVNDGSTDHTSHVIAEAAHWLPLKVVNHHAARGRSGAANAGARQAQGAVLLFLDGDTIVNPEFVSSHRAAHAAAPYLIGRGETYHIRGTRFFQNPETGTPVPGCEAQLAHRPEPELTRLRVTRAQVMDDFGTIECKAGPGAYPGAGPGRLYCLEMDALIHHPDCTVLWAAASGVNLSMRREEFLRVGGFDEALDINEHRELALRLSIAGARMGPVLGARSYHLTHRSGWRDPLRMTDWEEIFYRRHPMPAVKLLSVFWACLSDRHRIPRAAQINSLPELEIASRGNTGVDYDAVRELIRERAMRRSTAANGAERKRPC